MGKTKAAGDDAAERTKAKAEEEMLQKASEDDLRMMQGDGDVAAPKTNATKEDPVKSKSKTTKKAAKDRATKGGKVRGVDWDAAQKETKKATSRSAQEDLVVFAFRLTPAERDAIHKFAGPAKASRFLRTLAVAAARGDDAGIKNILKTIGSAEK